MSDIDKWAAEQCCNEYVYLWDGKLFYMKGDIKAPFEWTITDPRCREIVRDHFKIITDVWPLGGWCAHQHLETNRKDAIGKTIAEAEIACITAIWEASDEMENT